MKLIGLVAAGFVVVFIAGCSKMGSPAIGYKEGKLLPCPEKPNCVTSVQQSSKQFIAPFHYEGSAQAAMQTLKSIILAEKNTRIISESGGYLHVTFTSTVFRFVDDVEFLVKPDQNLVDVRSASRLGYSDFGVNRKRVEALRKKFNTINNDQ